MLHCVQRVKYMYKETVQKTKKDKRSKDLKMLVRRYKEKTFMDATIVFGKKKKKLLS